METAVLRGGGGSVQFDTSTLMQGGMKNVYFAQDRLSVVAFFRRDDDPHRIDRLTKVINDFNPMRPGKENAGYWRDLFCWPNHLVEHPAYGIGVRLPVYPACFRFTLGMIAGQEKSGEWFNCIDPRTRRAMRYTMIAEAERGTLQGYLEALVKVARGVQRMHGAGLAHTDLSERNVLIDPNTGRAIIIDVDSLAVGGLYPPGVLGTRGYMAPEVVATRGLSLTDRRRRLPSAETDKHALAVMIYKYLLERHPLEGRRFIKGLSAEEEDNLLFGSRALYSEHPNDGSNRPVSTYFPASILGSALEELFCRVFVDGLVDPLRRPTAAEWATALCETIDKLVACSNRKCSHKWFVMTNTRSPKCSYCGMRYKGTFAVMKLSHGDQRGRHAGSEGTVILNSGRPGSESKVYRYHSHRHATRGPGQDDAALADVVLDADPRAPLFLRNLRLPGLMARLGESSSFQPVGINMKVGLVDGLELQFGPEVEARNALIALVRAA